MSDISTHPTSERLLAYHAGTLAPADTAEVERHVAACPACRAVVAALASSTKSGQKRSSTMGGQVTGPKSAPELPELFGRYKVLQRIGRGGMGSVYLAEDTQLGRKVALKVPHFSADEGPRALDRFLREAKAAATLDHPNICPVYDVGQVGGVHYLTMAYIEGKSLADYISRDKPPQQRQTVAVVRKLAQALQGAHERGIVHRDLKPANVMVKKANKEPVIMDFGLARVLTQQESRMTKDGALLGTPAYMPPEQVAGNVEAMGPLCDVYSLGVILYEMLTGMLPFEGPVYAILGQIMATEPPPPSQHRADLDPRLEALVLKAMAKKPEDRFQSMAAFAQALGDYLRTDSVPVPPTATLRPATQPPRSQPDEPFTNLDDATATAAETAPRPRAARMTQRQPARRRASPWPWVAAALVVVAGVGLGAVILIQTNFGTIKIEVDKAVSGVQVQIDGDTVSLAGLDEPLRLKASDHHLLVSGQNFETLSKKFTVKRGANEVLKIELVPRGNARTGAGVLDPKVESIPPVSPPGPVKGASADRKAAEWALSLGGFVSVHSAGEMNDIKAVTDLPTKPYTLRRIVLFGIRQVDDEALTHVEGLDNLEVLELVGTRVTDNGLKALRGLSNLSILFLHKTGVQGPGLTWLKNLKNLKTLGLDDTPVDDNGLVPLEEMIQLKWLTLSQTRVTNAGLRHLSRLTDLTNLHLNKLVISDAGLEALHTLTKLKELDLAETQVTAQGVEGLKKELPNCVVKVTLTAKPPEPAPSVPSPEFFNGKDLTGWDGDGRYWRVEDGAIVGELPPQKIKFNTFLVSKKKYRDFELRFQAKLSDPGNSGVQVRSFVSNAVEFAVRGPQCEIGNVGSFFTGSLVTEPSGQPAVIAPAAIVAKAFKSDKFNDFVIRCVGKRVTIRVNDLATVDEDASFLPAEGVIAWQLHYNYPGMKVSFRNIEFKDLSGSAAAEPKPAEPKPVESKPIARFVDLFNGRNLFGWEQVPNDPTRWTVENGQLVGRGGGSGMIFTRRDTYQDVHIKIEAMINDRGNSGLYFRVPFESPNPKGYEAQIYTSQGDQKTGSLYNFVKLSERLHEPDRWFEMEVIARGNHIQIFVNGKKCVDFIDDKKTYFRGRIGLQANGAMTVVRFRKVQVKEWQPGS